MERDEMGVGRKGRHLRPAQQLSREVDIDKGYEVHPPGELV